MHTTILALSFLYYAAVCYGNEFTVSKQQMGQVESRVSNFLGSISDSRGCVTRIAASVIFMNSELSGSQDVANLIENVGISESRMTISGRTAIACGALLAYSNRFPRLAIEFFTESVKHSKCKHETLNYLVTTYMTPKSLLLHGDLESGLVVDHYAFFPQSTPHYILLHILNTLESLPSSAWKSTGMFAANVYRWHQEQMQENINDADKVLMKLLQLSSYRIFTPQTALFAIQFQRHPAAALEGVSLQYVSHVLQDPAVVQSSLSLVIPYHSRWMMANIQLATVLLPKPETPRDHERHTIQANMIFFSKHTIQHHTNDCRVLR